MKKSIKKKIVVAFGIILVLVCLFNYMVGKTVYRNLHTNKSTSEMKMIAYSIIQKIELSFEHMRLILEELYRSQSKNKDILTQEIIESITNSEYVFLDEIAVVDAKGIGKTSSGLEINIQNTNGYKNAFKTDSKWKKYEVIEWNGQEYIMTIRPVRERHSVSHLILGMCSVEQFMNHIDAFNADSEIFIIDDQGKIIMDYETRGIAEHISEHGVISKKYVDISSSVQEINDNHLNFKGKVLYERLGDSNWYVSVIYEKDDYALKIFDYAMLSAMVLSAGIGLIAVYFMGDSLSRRMKYIALHIEDIAINERIEPISEEFMMQGDEIAGIAKSMSIVEQEVATMLKEIKESTDYVNDTISELRAKQNKESKDEA